MARTGRRISSAAAIYNRGKSTGRRQIEDIEIEYAARPWKPGVGGADFDRAIQFVDIRHTRVVSLPEPADGSWVNWRESEPWEFGLVVAGRLRERRAELALFRGLLS